MRTTSPATSPRHDKVAKTMSAILVPRPCTMFFFLRVYVSSQKIKSFLITFGLVHMSGPPPSPFTAVASPFIVVANIPAPVSSEVTPVAKAVATTLQTSDTSIIDLIHVATKTCKTPDDVVAALQNFVDTNGGGILSSVSETIAEKVSLEVLDIFIETGLARKIASVLMTKTCPMRFWCFKK